MLESSLVFLMLVLAIVIGAHRLPAARWPLLAVLAAGLAVAGSRLLFWRSASLASHLQATHVRQEIPEQRAVDGYVSSQSCQACHPSQYESWHATYHRTMTQAAGPESVLGDFNNVSLSSFGFDYLLQRRGDEFWAKVSRKRERGLQQDLPDVQIVMSTGSHHYQIYWVSNDASPAADAQSGHSNRLVVEFPFAWLIAEQRWIPREAALVMPPRSRQAIVVWSQICIRCHSTHGQPRQDLDHGQADTRVGELGIACEACHGPGEAHVRANQNPARRYRQHAAGKADPTIVQPERLSAELSSQVCGQCHSISTFARRDSWDGHWNQYRPGQDLLAVQNVVRPKRLETLAPLQEHLAQDPEFLRGRYWPDGMVRVSGREYNGMVDSKCYEGGQLSCLSCHSMHHSSPDDQLKPDRNGDQACLQCHESLRNRVAEHTHHAATSEGSRCYNCHMPHTTYGLLKAIRSHEITSPSAASSVATGRPNACNQCHVDQTLAWTGKHLQDWYGIEPPVLDDDQRHQSAMVRWLLMGDAGQRALAAWSLGWDAARKASGEDWLAPYLCHLLDDPYPAVRYIAVRSLRRLPDFADFEYDFVGTELARSEAQKKGLLQWTSQAGRRRGDRPAVLLDAAGQIDLRAFERLAKQRDDRDIDLQE